MFFDAIVLILLANKRIGTAHTKGTYMKDRIVFMYFVKKKKCRKDNFYKLLFKHTKLQLNKYTQM